MRRLYRFLFTLWAETIEKSATHYFRLARRLRPKHEHKDTFWVLEDGARRPPSYYGLPRPSHEFFTLHLTTPSSYFGLQDYSLPSPTGRGKPPNGGAGEGLLIWALSGSVYLFIFLHKYTAWRVDCETHQITV